MNELDKNLRPYAVSCDWLQLYIHIRNDFDPIAVDRFDSDGQLLPDEFQINQGYHFILKPYGTKVLRKVCEIYEPGGELLGIMAYEPYSPKLHPKTAILKVENAVLYQSDYIARVFLFLSAMGFKYKSITRMDLCYDSNELYGGLTHQNLYSRYQKNKYLKIGQNEYMPVMDGKYTIEAKRNRIGKDENGKNKYEEVQVIEGEISEHRMKSATWGMRSSGIQVQMYNKSQELRDKTMKHYIVDYWKMCGLDTDKDVWRIEIRIAKGRKMLQNKATGKEMFLHMNDLLTQETIEELFQTFAEKYFRFFHNSGSKDRIQRMNQLRVFSFTKDVKMRPKCRTNKKDYTRKHKIMINDLTHQIAECDKLGVSVSSDLKVVRKYYIDAYNMEKWYKEKGEKDSYNQEVTNSTQIDQDLAINPEHQELFYKYSDEVAQRAAELRKSIEESIKRKREKGKDGSD